MPTLAVTSILDRDLSRVECKEVIAIASPLLVETVNYATTALATVAATHRAEENESLAPLYLHGHAIEMADGVQVLVADGCGVAALPLVRSGFEALLSLDYILEDGDKWVQRSLAWTYASYTKRRTAHRSLDPEHEVGKQAASEFDHDNALEPFSVSPKDAREAAERLDRFLARDQFKSIAAEWSASKKPRWHSLGGGPANLEQLARHLNRASQYRYVYRTMSDTSHAADPARLIASIVGDASTPTILRSDPAQLRFVSILALTFLVDATRILFRRFRPGELDNLKKWNLAEYRDRLNELALDG